MTDPLSKMLLDDHAIIQARVYLLAAYDAGNVAMRGNDFMREYYRAKLLADVKRAAELLGWKVSSVESLGERGARGLTEASVTPAIGGAGHKGVTVSNQSGLTHLPAAPVELPADCEE